MQIRMNITDAQEKREEKFKLSDEKKIMKELTKGFPAKVIIMFAIPLMLGNIAQQLYSITDSKIVSLYVSSSSLAAVGATAVISNLIIGLMIGLTQGFAIVISQYFGSGEMDKLRRYVFGIFVLTTVISLILTIAGLWSVEPLLKILGTPEDIMAEAIAYLRIIIAGVIFTAFYNMSANILRAIGDSKRPLYCLFASIAINVVLDLLLIRVFHMGIQGAAYATIISQFIAAALCMGILFVKAKDVIPGKGEFDLKLYEYKKLMTFGLAMGMMACIVNIGTVILQSAINGLGTTTVVAHTSARRVLDIIMIMVYTIGFAMTTYVSQNYGARKIDRIRQGIIHAVIIDTIITTILVIWTYIWGTDVVGWIASSQDPQILKNGELYLKIGVVFFYFLGPLFIFRCSLQGMGAKTTPLVTSVIELIIKILSVKFLVPRVGYLGVALTEPISWVVMTIVLFIGVILTLKREAYLVSVKPSL